MRLSDHVRFSVGSFSSQTSFPASIVWKAVDRNTSDLTRMCALGVVAVDRFVQIGLQLFESAVELLAKRYLIEPLQSRFVEALADAVCLRVTLWFSYAPVVYGQIELVVVRKPGHLPMRGLLASLSVCELMIT
jgi:hypothetical protein